MQHDTQIGPSAERKNVSTRDTVCMSNASGVVSEHQEKLQQWLKYFKHTLRYLRLTRVQFCFHFRAALAHKGPQNTFFGISLSLRVLHNYTFLPFCQICRHFWRFYNPISAFLYIILASPGTVDSVRVWWCSVGCLTVKCETAPTPSWWSR